MNDKLEVPGTRASTSRSLNSTPTHLSISAFSSTPAQAIPSESSDTDPLSVVSFSVSFIGVLRVNVSMRTLNFDSRTQLTRAAIGAVLDAPHPDASTVPKHSLHTDENSNPLKWAPFLDLNTIDRSLLSGSSSLAIDQKKLDLIITSTSLSLSETGNDSHTTLLIHDLATVSFAAAGDPQSNTSTYVAYLANCTDSSSGPAARLGRWCYVLECPGHANTASAVVAAIGRAFELRYQQHQRQRQSSDTHEHPLPHAPLTQSPSSPLASGNSSVSEQSQPQAQARTRSLHGTHERSRPPAAAPDAAAQPFSSVALAYSASSASSHHLHLLPAPQPSDEASAAEPAFNAFNSSTTDAASVSRPPGEPADGRAPLVLSQSNSLSGRSTSGDAQLKDNSAAATDRSTAKRSNSIGHNAVAAASNLLSNQRPAAREEAGQLRPVEEPVEAVWYHGPISRQEAERLIHSDGEFLVRASRSHGASDAPPPSKQQPYLQYILSGMERGITKHLLLVDPSGRVRTRDRTWLSVAHLIEFHFTTRVPIASADSQLFLLRPVPGPSPGESAAAASDAAAAATTITTPSKATNNSTESSGSVSSSRHHSTPTAQQAPPSPAAFASASAFSHTTPPTTPQRPISGGQLQLQQQQQATESPAASDASPTAASLTAHFHLHLQIDKDERLVLDERSDLDDEPLIV